jgi:hypothetical protein
MTYWNTGDEEWRDPRITAAAGAFAMYVAAGSWCMSESRNRELPAEWFVPDFWVANWPDAERPSVGRKMARTLCDVGLWERVPGGYRYAVIQDCNTPEAVRKLRKRWRDAKGGDA